MLEGARSNECSNHPDSAPPRPGFPKLRESQGHLLLDGRAPRHQDSLSFHPPSLAKRPIYLLRDGDRRTINGISIRETDIEGYDGLVNIIDGARPDPMEVPGKDISSVDAIEVLQDTLKKGSGLYACKRV